MKGVRPHILLVVGVFWEGETTATVAYPPDCQNPGYLSVVESTGAQVTS